MFLQERNVQKKCLDVNGIFRPNLTINGYNLEIINVLTGKSLLITNKLILNFLTGYRLKRMLKHPFCSFLVMGHHGISSLLNKAGQ